jgi:hypothetical protein
MATPIDWAEVASRFWGPRFEAERIAGLKSKDFKTQYSWRTMHVTSYGYLRDADCKRAAERIGNLAQCFREAGMLAMIEKRRK